jgi:hypothetical protein
MKRHLIKKCGDKIFFALARLSFLRKADVLISENNTLRGEDK